MDQAALLKRIKDLRDEIDLLVRHNEAYDVYYSHTVKDQHLYVARRKRLQQIKRELADIKAGETL